MTLRVEFDKLIMYFRLQGEVEIRGPQSPLDNNRMLIDTSNFEIQIYFISYPGDVSISSIDILDRRTKEFRKVYGDTLSFLELKYLQ